MLCAKYKVRQENGAHCKQHSSRVRRGIGWGAELLRKGLKWTVHDEKIVRFWEDLWVGDRPLCGGLESLMDEDQRACKVFEMWQQGAWWNWGQIEHILPASRLMEVASVVMRTEDLYPDVFEWKLGKNWCTMKMAYMLCRNKVDDDNWAGWRRIWRLRIQQRIKIFVWLFARGRILTNAERRRRRLTSNDSCVHCDCGVKDEMHAIRDSSAAKEMWNVLIPVDKASKFYGLGRREWILWLLNEGNARGGMPRGPERMLSLCWLQWRWRNSEVFEGNRPDAQQRLRQSVACFEEDEASFVALGSQKISLGGLAGRRDSL